MARKHLLLFGALYICALVHSSIQHVSLFAFDDHLPAQKSVIDLLYFTLLFFHIRMHVFNECATISVMDAMENALNRMEAAT